MLSSYLNYNLINKLIMINIILCALNEASILKKIIEEIDLNFKNFELKYRVIFCIDGSNDNSEEIIKNLSKKYPIIILANNNIRGLGNAFKRILKYCANNYDKKDLIISLDCDLTHNPAVIFSMINLLNNNNLDLVIGSRFVNNAKIENFPFKRLLISKIIRVVLKLFFPIKKSNNHLLLQDYSSGFRVYRNEILQNLIKNYGDNFLTQKNFTYTCELLIKLANLNGKIGEFPIFYNYQNRIGNSKLNVIKNGLDFIMLIFQLKFNKIFKKYSNINER